MAECIGRLNLVLLGATGAGKSASGNTILGRQAFQSNESLTSVTRDIAVETGTVGCIPVTVYDTPGLFNTTLSEEKTQQILEKVLQECESGSYVFLLVIKAKRFTEKERKTVEKIEKLLGENRIKNTWILFTRGDELEEENMTIKLFIGLSESLTKIVQKFDQRYYVFNNKTKEPSEQAGLLLAEIILRSLWLNELDIRYSPWCPEFNQELLPSAERTALLYHLSYLYLGGFPKLEHLIRERAIETQLLFGSSEAVLLKCVGTSSNLDSSLFPILKIAVELKKPILAVTLLEKAKTWISDIIRAVDDMVKRYDLQNESVAMCTSDVFEEQMQTEEKITKHSDEMKALEDALAKLELEMRNQDWKFKIQQTDLQQKLATSKIKMGVIPSPVLLKEVQLCLSEIHQILIDLKKFWEKVGFTLDTLKERTFVGEELVDMEDMKDEFLKSIEEAGKYWQRFGVYSQTAQGVFSVQSKDAYKFLAINPSSLSEEERNNQYKSIMEKLKKISPQRSSTV